MTTPSLNSLHPHMQPLSRAAAVVTLLVGALVLVGWAFDIILLKSVWPGLVTMKANTTLAFALAGASLWLSQTGDSNLRRRLARAFAFGAALIGLLTLVEYLTGADLGIDQLLIADASNAAQTGAPGRMSPVTALSFALIGCALMFLDAPTRTGWWPSQICVLSAFALALLSLLGYAYDVRSLYAVGPFTSIALHTAATLAVLCIGVLVARPDRGLMALLTSTTPGGFAARRLLPAAVLLPVVLGWLRVQGQREGLFGTEFGVALLITAAIVGMIVMIWTTTRSLDRTELQRRAASQALQDSQGRLLQVMDALPMAAYTCDTGGLITYFNARAAEVWGRPPALNDPADRFCGSWKLSLPDGTPIPHDECWMAVALRTQQAVDGREIMVERPDGARRLVLAHASPLRDSAGLMIGAVNVLVDMTERKHLEGQLRQSQKMEAIGRLTGGIAHDFNNLLTVILSDGQMLLMKLAQNDPHRELVEEILAAAKRAADLTRQLLAFSRKQVLQPKVMDMNEVVARMDLMLRRVLGEDISLTTSPAPDLRRVKADPGQIEQVLMNLAVNARDAMPDGGALTIETANVELGEQYARGHTAVTPGRYVMLAVSDTGSGMDKETQAHIFEPFFTTKEKGKGTGLGLATVYGIVKQSGGSIWVYSEPGRGTTFKIYLPQCDEPDTTPLPDAEQLMPMQGGETILLVEDDGFVRALAERILKGAGYRVLSAGHGNEAFRLNEQHEGDIHLLLTDVVMPGLNGREIAAHFAARRPRIKVLYMSGYTDGAITRHGMLDPDAHYLPKPFTPDQLAVKVREVLNG